MDSVIKRALELYGSIEDLPTYQKAEVTTLLHYFVELETRLAYRDAQDAGTIERTAAGLTTRTPRS
jgi:hypothetical protein